MTEEIAHSSDSIKFDQIADYKNPEQSISDRVESLLSQMTLEEKINQMLCIWQEKETLIFDEDGNFDLTDLKQRFVGGIGQIGRLSDSSGGLSAQRMVEISNEIQQFFVEQTRLGIPVIFHEECLHGLAGKEATSYPQPIGLAATFNPELVREIFSAISDSVRSRGAHQALTPVLDVARDPRWGRVEETFGEDPYLIAQLGIAAVRGLQKSDGSTYDGELQRFPGLIATLKHFAAHGEPDNGANCGPVNISERMLRDVFLYPFERVIREAGPASVMASYNEIDGVPSHANPWLLKQVLRDEWEFQGFVVSDYYAITELNEKENTNAHFVARDKKNAALLAANAGVNLEFPEPDCYPELAELVETGDLDESVIDELVAPLLEYKFKLGLFDEPYTDPDNLNIDAQLESDRPIALQAARETITLLKNDENLLPLDMEPDSTLAVIGPNADRQLLGGYSGEPKYYTTVLQGITDKLQGKDPKGDKNIHVVSSEGCKITVGGSWDEDEVTLPDPEEDERLIKEAVETAEQSDVVVLVLGDNEQISREAWSKDHLGDRATLELFGRQNDLVRAVKQTGKPVIVVLINGRPNSIEYIHNNVPAILECWYLGQETGHAVADVLFGDYNPSGKLPISIPRSVGHLPAYYNHKPSARRGYLFDDISPLYPFGYGLSYTTFQLSNVRLGSETIKSTESTQVFVDIQNTGPYAGKQVIQLYIRDLVSSVTRPVKELRGFRKIHLDSGESRTVALEIRPEHLAFTDINKTYTVEPGEFEIMVGASSRDKDLQKTVLHVV
ncbi:MAG: glycoside hydrolase family 3 C-terminal domain-containing protein [Candidatus Marinimicrobia bacterium]|nr:glycoside hydrolase family 3 C-terminal domain-containing protein [Candidatus Neomarinimicrobiota bacterium]MCF7880613.1 glycoside hydrolase family 3 C-terminal domain-containing protein [Candidatus Neomarinimicrobiota bacterium]